MLAGSQLLPSWQPCVHAMGCGDQVGPCCSACAAGPSNESSVREWQADALMSGEREYKADGCLTHPLLAAARMWQVKIDPSMTRHHKGSCSRFSAPHPSLLCPASSRLLSLLPCPPCPPTQVRWLGCCWTGSPQVGQREWQCRRSVGAGGHTRGPVLRE